MKATYSTIQHSPRVELPPEMLERVYMYCTAGGLSAREIRKLYPAGVLLGMDGMTDREIVQNALVNGAATSTTQPSPSGLSSRDFTGILLISCALNRLFYSFSFIVKKTINKNRIFS